MPRLSLVACSALSLMGAIDLQWPGAKSAMLDTRAKITCLAALSNYMYARKYVHKNTRTFTSLIPNPKLHTKALGNELHTNCQSLVTHSHGKNLNSLAVDDQLPILGSNFTLKPAVSRVILKQVGLETRKDS